MMNPQDDTLARGPDDLFFGDFPDNILHTYNTSCEYTVVSIGGCGSGGPGLEMVTAWVWPQWSLPSGIRAHGLAVIALSH